MQSYTYEIHAFGDPLLPFRFRPYMDVTERRSPANWHEETEVLYCFGGTGHVQLGGESVPFEKGDTVVVNTRTPHFVMSEESVQYCCLIVKGGFLKENGVDPALLHFEHRIQGGEMQEKAEAVRAAFGVYDPGRPESVLQIRSAVLSLFCLLCQKHASPSREQKKSNEAVNRALTYLHTRFREKLSLDELAAWVGVSKFHLSREFKRATGRPVMETVLLLRLYEAKELIEKGERISDAARSCGFSNLSYFTRCFRKQFALLPSDLRKKLNRNT